MPSPDEIEDLLANAPLPIGPVRQAEIGYALYLGRLGLPDRVVNYFLHHHRGAIIQLAEARQQTKHQADSIDVEAWLAEREAIGYDDRPVQPCPHCEEALSVVFPVRRMPIIAVGLPAEPED